MITVATHRRGNKNGFDTVAEPFLQSEGLPFSSVLSAEWIQRVFCEENALLRDMLDAFDEGGVVMFELARDGYRDAGAHRRP